MVKIACKGESKVVRSMMESLAELAEKEGETVIPATQCVAKFPVKTLLSVLRAKEGYGRLTLTFHENTGNIQIHSSAVVKDESKEFLAELETWYVEVCLADGYMDERFQRWTRRPSCLSASRPGLGRKYVRSPVPVTLFWET